MTDDELADKMVDIFYSDSGPRKCMKDALEFAREHDRLHRLPETEKPRRVAVQIVGIGNEIFALANDGRIYGGVNKIAFAWQGCLPDLPQD